MRISSAVRAMGIMGATVRRAGFAAIARTAHLTSTERHWPMPANRSAGLQDFSGLTAAASPAERPDLQAAVLVDEGRDDLRPTRLRRDSTRVPPDVDARRSRTRLGA